MNDNALSALYHLYYADDALTTTELARMVFEPEGKDEVRNAERKVRHYLKNTVEHLVVEVSDEPVEYDVQPGRVHFGAGALYVSCIKGEEITTGLGEVAVVHGKEGDEPEVHTVGDEIRERPVDADAKKA